MANFCFAVCMQFLSSTQTFDSKGEGVTDITYIRYKTYRAVIKKQITPERMYVNIYTTYMVNIYEKVNLFLHIWDTM